MDCTGWLASRFQNIMTFLIVGAVVPPAIGRALIFSETNRGVRLFAYYCLQTGLSAIPLTLGLLSANFKGVTKNMTITANLFATYCAGNIAGPQTFISSEAKRGYPTAFKAILICYGLVIVVSIGLRLYLIFVNKSRDRTEGSAVVDVGTPPEKKDLTAADYEDITDFNTNEFQYRM